MRVDAPSLAEAARTAVPSLYRPHPRYRLAVTAVADARLLPTLTVNRLNQNASTSGIANWTEMGTKWQRVQEPPGFGPMPSTISVRNITYIAKRRMPSVLGRPRVAPGIGSLRM